MSKSEKMKQIEKVSFDTLTEHVDEPDEGVIRHPSHVVVSADDVPRTSGKRTRSSESSKKS